jgi:AraC-like DNA-binding protein
MLRYASLSGYLDVAHGLGLDPDELIRSVDLDPADLATPEKWVAAAPVARLLDVSARAAGSDDFGLRLADHRRLSTLGPLSLVLRDEPTLRSALELLMRYEHSYNEALRIRLTEVNGLATLRLWFEFGDPTPSRQSEELAMAVLHGILREFLGPNWQPLSVCFSHHAPRSLETHKRLLGTRLHFGHSFTGLVLYARDLDATIATTDPGVRERTAEVLQSLPAPRGEGTADRVQQLVEALLPTGRCSADEVARTLGINQRTLHRHLAATDDSFSSIVDKTRAGLAERYLSAHRYRLTDISGLLGFAAPSAFSRWFRKKFGDSPRQWRILRAGSTAP